MAILARAETAHTEYRGDGTLPGIMAKLEESGRVIGFWSNPPDGYCADRLVHVYVKGKSGQTTVAMAMSGDAARRLAASLLAMADQVAS